MQNAIFDRRRIERYAQLLEEAGHPRHDRSPLDDELAGYVGLGQRIRETQHPSKATPEEDFRTSLRAMLVATAQREGIGRTAGAGSSALGRAGVAGTRDEQYTEPATERARPPRLSLRSRRARGAIIVGLAAGTLALSGMSAASGDAMPGDPLYGVKRSAEGARLALTTTDMMRGQLYLDFAGIRANEAARGSDPSGLTGLLDDMDSQTIEGVRLLTGWTVERHDLAALDFIDTWVGTQHARLAGLEAAGSDRERVVRSLTLLYEIEGRSETLRSALACGASTGRADRFGPVPGACPATGGHTGTGTIDGSTGNRGSSGSSGGGSGSGGTPPAGTPPRAAPSPTANPATSPTHQTYPPSPRPSSENTNGGQR